MERAELAARLVGARDDAERAALLEAHAPPDAAALAYALKDSALEAWTTDPARVLAAARSLKLLAARTADQETHALASWAEAVAALTEGRMERAVKLLDEAETKLNALGKTHAAAGTNISKMVALAMLGRYEEAVACGLRAREIFLSHGDARGAGRAEQNVGNLYLRRDRYREAEEFHRAARARFDALGDRRQLAEIDNCLATIRVGQHRLRDAERLYEQALASAEAAGMAVRRAEIEASMGNLALFQGRYDRALDLLERSRRRYASLRMPHQSAIAEQEIADAYLELNLAPEAASIYERVAHVFAELGMRAERARALAQHARASILLGRFEQARPLLAEAGDLYAAEENPIGEATVRLTEARLRLAGGDYAGADDAAARAEASLAASGTWRLLLLARWLRGEAARARGSFAEASKLLSATLRDAEERTQPQVAERCHTSLGLLEAARGDAALAEASFRRAVELIESLRAPLPAEELRTAFFSDKLTPYRELMRLCLDAPDGRRVIEAFAYAERARSRALAELMGGDFGARAGEARDEFETGLLARLKELREELNWFYGQLNRRVGGASGDDEVAALEEALREREAETLEITRRLWHRGVADGDAASAEPFDQDFVARLQAGLGAGTALVEYASLDGELLAFVVTGRGVVAVRGLGFEAEVEAALSQLRFQLDALRHGASQVRRHLPRLAERTRGHLRALHDLLLSRVEPLVGDRRLVVVPHRALNYVPFHALFDGDSYLVERREVCYAPSAVVLRRCLSRTPAGSNKALLLGVPDEQTPRVAEEVAALAPLFGESVALVGNEATLGALAERAGETDLLHLACHGQFRPDNPLFSSLRLADGWLTVRDATALDLRRCGVATLSACETGLSAVAPGDELIGLARGFFAAGARSLVLSLWVVDDDSTAELMRDFYARLRAGDSPAAALRAAQLSSLGRQPHPFFWSPFVLLGRW